MFRAAPLPPLRDDIRGLALNYAAPALRGGLHALWALDEALGQVVRTTSEPMIGQMRLTWWHERLSAINSGASPAEPVLAGLAHELPRKGSELAAMVEGWEVLLDPLPLSDTVIAEHATVRGGGLFALAAGLLGDATDVRQAGAGWAAMDFALHCSDADTARRAQTFARSQLTAAATPKAKALRILARVARQDAGRELGSTRSRFALLRAVLF